MISIRLSDGLLERLDELGVRLRKNRTQLLEEAAIALLSANPTPSKYELVIAKTRGTLLRYESGRAKVLENFDLNGTPPEVLQKKYAVRFNEPVGLTMQE